MILVLTNADTEILALRCVLEDLPVGFPPVRAANPSMLDGAPSLDGVDAVLVRLLGGRRAWEEAFDALRRGCVERAIPLLAFGGEAVIDAELTELSTVPSPVVTAAFAYLAQGGLANTAQLLRFVADAVLGTEFGHDAPVTVPAHGLWRCSLPELAAVTATDSPQVQQVRPRVGVVFYRAHVLSGNTQFIDDLCDAIERRGADAVAVYCYSLRPGGDGRVPALELLSEHGVGAVVTTVLAMGSSDGDEWDASALAALDVPVIQAMAATGSVETWRASSVGLAPIDVAMSVAIPEFDGRIVSVPFSFKEVVDDTGDLGTPVVAYRTVPDRVERVAGIATRWAALRHVPPGDRRIAVVLSSYPTKQSRIGNAVGLDTPASVITLLEAMRASDYVIDRIPASGDELMAELAALVPARAERPVLDLGNVLVAVQPPRGFGDNPVAIYHSPDLPPVDAYVGFYRWLDEQWAVHAIVHVGKHGTLEWLPGKGIGLSGDCWPDVVLGDVPLLYPFVVNDPGEGTQAKRRAHAVIVDHLLPPMTRAETYDDLARLESLLDEYARVQALDPTKLPALRAQVWELLVRAELHRDLGVDDAPAGDEFDGLLLHVDGYLCELKDAQIRGGLHTLGHPPTDEALVDLVLAMTRLPQGAAPSLRAAVARELGLDLEDATRDAVDRVEAECRARVSALHTRGWRAPGDDPTLTFVANRLVPALERATDEITNLLHGLDGGYVPAGPSGAPTRGMAHVLPTGRNFWSVDPKALPTPLAWEVGRRLADALIERATADQGVVPQTVGLVVWGTSAMRTGGDDVAEALALLGVRPVWAEESGRVTGIELIPAHELGRPRVDVVLRISGFFRDAFPHLVQLLDDAVRLAGYDDDPRIFGAKPGAYGSGILPLLESGAWSTDDDLAAVYMAWGGWSYGRDGMGRAAPDAMRRRFATIDLAVKNQDNREHDIFDSDDYLQDHGGMIATVRALRGEAPMALFGDSADPARPRVRTLSEEAARVVRTRVVNPKWITAMMRHGYKGAFEMAATVDYLFGYDATAHVVEDWMYERVTERYVADPDVRKFFEASNPWALRSIAERLLEAVDRGLWDASDGALATLRSAVLEGEGWEEER